MAKEKKTAIEEPKNTSSKDILLKLKNNINAHYERKVVILGSEKTELPKIETGIFPIDVETEGGIPRGRWIILVGDESSFKSTLMYHIAGKMQRVCATCMSGIITEKNYKKVTLPNELDKSNENIEVGKTGELYSKKYFATKNKMNAYCPGELMTHGKEVSLLEYELECSNCNNPEYSIFLLVDSEHNYTKSWASKWGVVHYYTALSDTSHSQMTGDIIREAMGTGKVSFVAIDSLDSHGAAEEMTASLEEWQVGLQARVWNKIVRIITSLLNTTFVYTYTNKVEKKIAEEKHQEPVICIIQQWREKIMSFGDPKVMGGGRGKNFASSLTIALSAGEKVHEMTGGSSSKKDYLKGSYFNFILKKHKVGRPERTGRFYFNQMTHTVDNASAIFDYALKYKLIEQGGAWYTVGEERFQGEEKVKKYLSENPKVMESLKIKILKSVSEL
ncbi:MAG: hypothetical protein WC998_08760 [Candidatus Paceibacterota bacterium]